MRFFYAFFALLAFQTMAIGQKSEDFKFNGYIVDVYGNTGTIKGSPFLIDEWVDGKVKSITDSTYRDLKIRYNTEFDRIEIDYDAKVFGLSELLYNEFRFTYNQDGQPKEYLFKNKIGENPKAYYQIIFESDIIIFAIKHKTVIKESQVNRIGVIEDKRYYSKSSNYYIIEDGQSTKVKKNKKSIIQNVKRPKALERIVKKEKLNLKNEADIITALQMYSASE